LKIKSILGSLIAIPITIIVATAANAQGLDVDDPIVFDATSGVHEPSPVPSVSDPVFEPTPVPNGPPSFPDPNRSATQMPDSGITDLTNTLDRSRHHPFLIHINSSDRFAAGIT
jgi:hypothetical protein